MQEAWKIGIIGGSGLGEIAGFTEQNAQAISTPWGAPSGSLISGRIGKIEVCFLARHGQGHSIPPSQVNYRANIAALKQAGCTDLLSISAVGSLREELAPGTFVLIDQFIDRTFRRESSFFGPGLVAHVALADPICPRLAGLAAQAARAAGAQVVMGATYLAMEGPQFSTRAESRLYRQWGCDVIGMTNMPEAKLAREAELPYATIAMVTDYDSWRDAETGVDVSQILACMHANAAKARALIPLFLASLPASREPSPIDRSLEYAIITAQEAQDPEMRARLAWLNPRLFPAMN